MNNRTCIFVNSKTLNVSLQDFVTSYKEPSERAIRDAESIEEFFRTWVRMGDSVTDVVTAVFKSGRRLQQDVLELFTSREEFLQEYKRMTQIRSKVNVVYIPRADIVGKTNIRVPRLFLTA